MEAPNATNNERSENAGDQTASNESVSSAEAAFSGVAELTEQFLAAADQAQVDKSVIGSKAFNSQKLLDLASQDEKFSAPKQLSLPNYILQSILAEIKMSYLEQLGQLSDKNLNEQQVEQIRTYTIQLVRDQIECKQDILTRLVAVVQAAFADSAELLAIRSSSSQEDLDG